MSGVVRDPVGAVWMEPLGGGAFYSHEKHSTLIEHLQKKKKRGLVVSHNVMCS